MISVSRREPVPVLLGVVNGQYLRPRTGRHQVISETPGDLLRSHLEDWAATLKKLPINRSRSLTTSNI
jgi:hypothetical protein